MDSHADTVSLTEIHELEALRDRLAPLAAAAPADRRALAAGIVADLDAVRLRELRTPK